MSTEFSNGFALGLALAYKKAAEGWLIGNFIIRHAVESVFYAPLVVQDIVSLSDAIVVISVSDSVPTPILVVSDTVATI